MEDYASEAGIFLSYAREDHERVVELYERLADAGFSPWMDTENLLGGEDWQNVLQNMIKKAPSFLACLSSNSVGKRGVIQEETRLALDVWRQKLDSDIYLIPVRLEPCKVPDQLGKFHRVDLFEDDGFERLVKALEEGARRIGTIQPRKNEPDSANSRKAEDTPRSFRIPLFLDFIALSLFLFILLWLIGNTHTPISPLQIADSSDQDPTSGIFLAHSIGGLGLDFPTIYAWPQAMPVEVLTVECPSRAIPNESATFTATVNDDVLGRGEKEWFYKSFPYKPYMAIQPVVYRWDFGDGTTATGTTATGLSTSHIYGQAGTYTVSFVATNRLSSDSDDCTVRVIPIG